MGKLKTIYPIKINIQFFLFLENSQLLRDMWTVQLQNSPLLYMDVYHQFEQFLNNNKINYESYMFFQALNADQQLVMDQQWTLDINEIEERGQYIMIRVKSHTQYIKQLFYNELGLLNSRLEVVEQKVSNTHIKEDNQLKIYQSSPIMRHTSSIGSVIVPEKDLDIGILFSEPIFDEKKHKQASMPVDFRSQIQRLYSALNPEITVECEIATKEHLKHLIGLKKPKILHIICHGSKDGELEFEDDSKFSLGSLCTIDSIKIKQILLSEVQSVPSLVFINSCYSQLIGNIFFQVGAKYVIMIDSQDKIDDEAAQIFSQNFYRNIFRGQKVDFSFKQAKDSVGIKHNSFGCCCRHTSVQKHRIGCRWLVIVQEMGQEEAHKIYHVPSQNCHCQLRNLNRHKLTCEWARFSLFHINKDFRIQGENEERFPIKRSQMPNYLPYQKKQLVICCCFNFEGDQQYPRIPHSECNKFKMLPTGEHNCEPLYQLQKGVSFRTQIIDYSAPQLMQFHDKLQNCCVMGRQQELYEFINKIKDPQISTFILYGLSGVGKTTFSIKTATYLIERNIYEIYFFIDLYDIKDKQMFRHKFNEITKFGYPNNRESLNQVRNKQMIIIFDNADNFFMDSILDFQQQIQNLRNQIYHTKFIITCNEKNFPSLQNQNFCTNNCFVKEMRVLDENSASKVLFSKIRNYIDISVDYMDILGLVANKKQLQIPKIIENLSHSFCNLKVKIKIGDLRKKIQQLGAGDYAFNKLVQENLIILKNKSKQTYKMLIFISQFSQGLDKNNLNILSMQERTQNCREYINLGEIKQIFIDFPVNKNWKEILAVLFEQQIQPKIKNMLNTQYLPKDCHSFNKIPIQAQAITNRQANDEEDSTLRGESYFLQESNINKFIVKRFIRDFIWNKDNSDQNFYMKHIFVAYTAVVLDTYIKFLVAQRYIHEEILQYSQISQAGIYKYKYKDNDYTQINLTDSTRCLQQDSSKFQKIIKEQLYLKQKIKCCDPSVFILNHKLDFLHIYNYDWSKVYGFLKQKTKGQATILINYLQKLIILIPTAIKIANFEDSLLQYSIRQSIILLSQIRKFSNPNHSLLLALKLKLMKARYDLLKGDYDISKSQYQSNINKNDLQQISSQTLRIVNIQFPFQIGILQIYKQYKRSKQIKKLLQPSIKMGADRLIQMIKTLQKRVYEEQEWTANQICEILHAKRHLILAMTYFQILDASTKYISNLTILNQKKNLTPILIKFAQSASQKFFVRGMIKLGLRAKLIGICIIWETQKYRAKKTQFNEQLYNQQQKLNECQAILQDKKNNLMGLTNFDILIKRIKKQMKQKMWQESVSSFILMKAVPLSNKRNAFLENMVRKRKKYRDYVVNMFDQQKIDISLKFLILTCEKLQQESKKGCTILVLNTNIKVQNNRAFLILEGNDLKERQLQIGSEFIQEYPILNSKLLIIIGNNAYQGIKRLSFLGKKLPTMVSITTCLVGELSDFEVANYQNLLSSSISELKQANNKTLKSQIELAKYLIKSLMNSNNNAKRIKQILDQLQIVFKQQLKQLKINIIQNHQIFIPIVKGNYKDLSPGYRKTHNIDFQFNRSPDLVYRKWKELSQVFKEISISTDPKYIQICGSNGVGKSTFLQQIGRMFIERGLFCNGVYIMQGRQIQQKCQSDFEAYIIKNSENGNLFTLQYLTKYGNSKFMLMIDDFHLIKPKSNGRYNIFLNRLVDKQVNLILVTHESFSIKDIFSDIKTIRLQKMNAFQLDLYAYSVLDLNNPAVIKQYQEDKKKKKISFQDIFRIKNKYKTQNSPDQVLLSKQQPLKKMLSNRF